MILSLVVVVFISLSCNLARAASEGLVRLQIEAQAFVDHAIKQKFAGTYASIEHALKLFDEANVQDVGVLRDSLNECRHGHDTCLLAGIICMLQSAELSLGAVPKRERRVEKLISAACEEWEHVFKVPVQMTTAHDAGLFLDWEMLRLVVSASCQRLETVKVGFDNNQGVLLVAPSPPSSRIVLEWSLLKCAMEQHLEVAWDQRGFIMRGCEVRSMPAVVPRAVAQEEASLPPGLTFAVLDDSLLTRRSVMQIIQTHLQGNMETSFAMGERVEDVDLFVSRVVNQGADIVILDQHLDYEHDADEILGTQVAATLRRRGFAGMVVIHTADARVEYHHAPNNHIDGVLEKTSSREVLRRNLARVWGRR
jgi:hypothetical protein